MLAIGVDLQVCCAVVDHDDHDDADDYDDYDDDNDHDDDDLYTG